MGGVFSKLMWAQGGQHRSLDKGPELCESGEIELSTSKQASIDLSPRLLTVGVM